MAAASAQVSQPRDYPLIVEKDVAIPLRDGTILYKLVGPVTPDNIDAVLKAEIDKALKAGT